MYCDYICLCMCFFSNFKKLPFTDCETVSMDENMIGNEAVVMANCDASYEIPTWKRCSAECLRKLLPNPASYMFRRRASLTLLDHGLSRNDASAPSAADSGLWSFAVRKLYPSISAICGEALAKKSLLLTYSEVFTLRFNLCWNQQWQVPKHCRKTMETCIITFLTLSKYNTERIKKLGVLASEGWWEAWQPSPKVTRSC